MGVHRAALGLAKMLNAIIKLNPSKWRGSRSGRRSQHTHSVWCALGHAKVFSSRSLSWTLPSHRMGTWFLATGLGLGLGLGLWPIVGKGRGEDAAPQLIPVGRWWVFNGWRCELWFFGIFAPQNWLWSPDLRSQIGEQTGANREEFAWETTGFFFGGDLKENMSI